MNCGHWNSTSSLSSGKNVTHKITNLNAEFQLGKEQYLSYLWREHNRGLFPGLGRDGWLRKPLWQEGAGLLQRMEWEQSLLPGRLQSPCQPGASGHFRDLRTVLKWRGATRKLWALGYLVLEISAVGAIGRNGRRLGAQPGESCSHSGMKAWHLPCGVTRGKYR